MHRRFGKDQGVVAFALAGGGSRAAVQVGMLQALSDAGIRPDLVSGTSAGAVNAVWYGMYPDRLGQLQEIWGQLRTRDVFPGNQLRIAVNLLRDGYIHSSRAWQAFLQRQIGYASFEDTQIPVLVLAVRMSDGLRRVFDRGPLVPSVMASTAIPGVFPPFSIESELYVDGGVIECMPVPAVQERGADVIYALDCSGYAPQVGSPPGSVVDRCGQIAAKAYADAVCSAAMACGLTVHLLRPDIPDVFDARDFRRTAELISIGYEYTKRYLAGADTASASRRLWHARRA